MHRSFYSFSIVVNLLVACLVFVEVLLYAMIGNRLMYLDRYSMWLLVTLLFTSLQGAVMMRYFKIKGYQAAFWMGIVSYVTTILLIFVNYATAELGFGAQLVIPLYIAAIVIQVVYSSTLSLSLSRERLWLRIAGWCGTLLASITLCLVVVIASGEFIEYHIAIERFHALILGASAMPSLMLALNFYRELQIEPIDRQNEGQPDIFYYGRSIVVVIALIFIGLFATGGFLFKAQLPMIESAVKKAAEPFEARVFVSVKGDTLKYRLLKPLNFDPSKKYPIVVCLHGSSGTGNDNYRQVAAAVMPMFLANKPSNREKFPAFVFVPQCTFGTSWGGHPLPGIDDIVFDAMASIENEFPIDSTRRYVTGISLGGYGTWHFIETRPEFFAAAIPICGVGDPDLASKCADVAVWAFHGAHDERVPVSGSRDMIEALKAVGGNPRYTEFPDAGHDIAGKVIETPELLDWLFAQKR